MKQQTTQMILLKRLNFSEADRIITVITPDHGKLSLLAKGVRRPNSKLAGGIELFCISAVTYIDGRSDLKTISSTRLERNFDSIAKDLLATSVAYELLRLSDMHSEHLDDTSELYQMLNTALEDLDNKSDVKTVFIWFLHNILDNSGSGVNLEKPLNAATFDADSRYQFSYDDMSFLVSEAGSITGKHIKYLRLVGRAGRPRLLKSIQDYKTVSEDLYDIFQHLAKVHVT